MYALTCLEIGNSDAQETVTSEEGMGVEGTFAFPYITCYTA